MGTEAELARELNVSRPAVREAVRLLVRANLLRAARGPGGGVFVARSPDRGLARTVSDAVAGMLANTTTSLCELTEVRLLLEVPLAGLAAEHASAEKIAELWRAVEDATARPDVVLLRVNGRQMMVLSDAMPGLRIEGKPQCHIVALAKDGEVAASVGCALSRARTGMRPDEMTVAIPGTRLAAVVDAVERTAAIDTVVAKYAADDARRFAVPA